MCCILWYLGGSVMVRNTPTGCGNNLYHCLGISIWGNVMSVQPRLVFSVETISCMFRPKCDYQTDSMFPLLS